jgi:hypothetical protein
MALLRRLLFFKERFDMATTLPSVWALLNQSTSQKYCYVTPRLGAGATIKKVSNCPELKITCRVNEPALRPLRRGRFLLPHAFPSVTLVWSDTWWPTARTMVQLGTHIVWDDEAKPSVFDSGWRLCCMR